MQPSSPRPGDTVQVSAVNLPAGDVLYTWRINGQTADQGRSVTGVTFTAGNTGSATVVQVTAASEFETIQKSVTVRPAIVDLVWEGDTYTPPLYSGLPLVTGSSDVVVQAIPTIVQGGSLVAVSNLNYTWYVNSSPTPAAGGLGKNSVTFDVPQFANPFTVRVVAETRDGTVRASGLTTVTPESPIVVVYENAPLLGTRFDRAIMTEFALAEDEATLEAFPLYVTNKNALDYEWRVNGSVPEEVRDTPRMITLRKEGVGSGRFSIKFSMESATRLFERASTAFQLVF